MLRVVCKIGKNRSILENRLRASGVTEVKLRGQGVGEIAISAQWSNWYNLNVEAVLSQKKKVPQKIKPIETWCVSFYTPPTLHINIFKYLIHHNFLP